MKIVKVVWKDAVGDYVEMTKEELKQYKLALVKSVGFLVKADKKSIRLASVIMKDTDAVRNWLVIPRAMVVDMDI